MPIIPSVDISTPCLRIMLNAVLASLTLDPDWSIEDLQIERQAAAAMLAAVTAGQVNPNKAVARPDWGTRSQRRWPRSATSALHSMPSDQNPGTVAQPGPPSPQWVGTTPWKSVPPDDDPGRDTG
jgi:hypothetical protein